MNIDCRVEVGTQHPNTENPMQKLGHFLKEARISVGAGRTFLTILMAPTGAVATTTIIDSLAPHTSVVAVASAEPLLAEICRNVVVTVTVRNFRERNGQPGYQQGADEDAGVVPGAKVQWQVTQENVGVPMTTDAQGKVKKAFPTQPCNDQTGTHLLVATEITTADGRKQYILHNNPPARNGYSETYNARMELKDSTATVTATPKAETSPTTTPTVTATARVEATPTPGAIKTPKVIATPTATPGPDLARLIKDEEDARKNDTKGLNTRIDGVNGLINGVGNKVQDLEGKSATKEQINNLNESVKGLKTGVGSLEGKVTKLEQNPMGLPIKEVEEFMENVHGVPVVGAVAQAGEFVIDLPAKGVDKFTDPDSTPPLRWGINGLTWLLLLGLRVPRRTLTNTIRFPDRFLRHRWSIGHGGPAIPHPWPL